MNINDLTIGQLKEIQALSLGENNNNTLNEQIGEKVIVRTYSAGVWFGYLAKKQGQEIILTQARRMYRWFCKKSISLSGVAIYGIDQEKSEICGSVRRVHLEAIEIISCEEEAIKTIEGAEEAQQS